MWLQSRPCSQYRVSDVRWSVCVVINSTLIKDFKSVTSSRTPLHSSACLISGTYRWLEWCLLSSDSLLPGGCFQESLQTWKQQEWHQTSSVELLPQRFSDWFLSVFVLPPRCSWSFISLCWQTWTLTRGWSSKCRQGAKQDQRDRPKHFTAMNRFFFHVKTSK